MPILDSEIVWRASALISDTVPAQNGGRMASAQIISGVKNNIFPDASQSERANGSIKFRKVFVHINSAQDVAFLNVRVFIDALTPGGDYFVFHIGTQTDTENQMTSRSYGVGALYENAVAAAESVKVDCEHNADYATLTPFRVGDLVRIADRPSTGGAGNEEWKTLTAVAYESTHALLTFTGSPLVNGYATSGTLISTVFEQAQIVAAITDWTETSGAGTYDEATTGNLIARNKGGIAQDWTLTFTDANTFAVSGSTVGSLGAGSRSSDFSPINPATNSPYFTIKSTGWGGTWAAGNQITFKTAPAALPVWYHRRIPPGTLSLANDYASLAIHGESA